MLADGRGIDPRTLSCREFSRLAAGPPAAVHVGDLPRILTRTSRLRRAALSTVKLGDRYFFFPCGKYFDIVTFWISPSSVTMPGDRSVAPIKRLLQCEVRIAKVGSRRINKQNRQIDRLIHRRHNACSSTRISNELPILNNGGNVHAPMRRIVDCQRQQRGMLRSCVICNNLHGARPRDRTWSSSCYEQLAVPSGSTCLLVSVRCAAHRPPASKAGALLARASQS